ncbi:hypothetical protein EV670_3711 [Rivibacter subsaxonicus]|uniref:DUF1223 domain-containing protein n=2 Tax=Rivibacter subsaxonicus TaxID=457575 RepID=A0A4Q7V7J9_9BURK|nr:hypothetical protein EV670_3711 [Rivibacter subsaxonicus]
MIATALLGTAGAHAATRCEARSAATPPAVVELYTSEGCSSCPPAEAWLNTLKGRPEVIALAFHVNYWDYIGWTDRFATPATTQRQRELARMHGRDGVYTPQVVLGGADWRGWGGANVPAPRTANAPGLLLAREGDTLTATVDAASGSQPLAGYWAVLEDGIETRVRAGENAGRTLRHDHVVRFYKPVPAWPAAQGQTLRVALEPGTLKPAQRAVFVVTEGSRPLQAVALACSSATPR